jgi:2-methylcitrate dehydratase
MTEVDRLAAFVTRACYGAISERGRLQLKIRVLDSLGCAIGALDGAPINAILANIEDFGGQSPLHLDRGRQDGP